MVKLNMTDGRLPAAAPGLGADGDDRAGAYGGIFVDTNGRRRDDAIHIFQRDPRWWTSIGAPDQWQQAITQLEGTGGTLSSSVPIPANRLELLAACVAQGTC